MKKKLFITFITLTLAIFSLSAQDKIYYKNSKVDEVKVLKVSEFKIEFKKFNNLDGPIFEESIANITMIVYENGEHQMFNQESNKNTNSNQKISEFRKKRLNLDLLAIGENGPTSISYEIINEDGSRGIEIPISVYFNADGVVGYTIGANLKYYVSSKQGKGFYVGPSLGLGAFDWYGYYGTSSDFSMYLGVKLGYQFQISELFGINLAGNAGGVSNFDDFDGAYSFNLGINFSF